MRRGDDDLSPFFEDPVFQALVGPATPEELAAEAETLAAFRAAAASPARRRRSAARLATGSTVAVLTVALTGGVAAAYTASLPSTWQQKLHEDLSPLHFPAPKKSHPKPSPSAPILAAPGSPSVSSPAAVAPTGTPTAGGVTPSPSATPTLPVGLETATASSTPTGTSTGTPTPSPTPTPTRTGPLSGATLAVALSARMVEVGGSVTVTGRLDAADSTPIAGRKVGLRFRLTGAPGWTRLDPQTTAGDGSVTFTVPDLEHNVRLVLAAGRRLHSAVASVAIVPIITVQVPPPVPGARTTTVTVTVRGGQPGDLITVRRPGGRKGSQTSTLDGSASATFTLPVSARNVIHYRVFVARTKAHAAHSLPFYVPASGTTTTDAGPST